MKTIFLFWFGLSTYFAHATESWRVVAETTSCEKDYKILAKTGEKFVLLYNGEDKIKLHSNDGSTYFEENPKQMIFSNTKLRVSFIRPSIVDGNLPKLKFTDSPSLSNCLLNLK